MRALRRTTRATATLTAAGVLALAAGPAMAADPTIVAQSEAEAIYLSIGPEVISDNLSGPFRAERTEDGETTEGNNEPKAELLTGQPSLKAGTLAQDARTGLAGDQGVSDACAGVAGRGSSFVGVSDQDRCLTPGDATEVALTPDGLDLEQIFDIELVGGTGTLGDILDQVGTPREIREALRQLNTNLEEAFAQFGADTGLYASLSAITSQCEAGPAEVASGGAELTDVSVFLRLPKGVPNRRVNLIDFETNPPPNTKVATEADRVVDEIANAFIDSLKNSDIPSDITNPLEDVRDAIRDQVLEQIADQLGPVEENLLDGTLNKQTWAPGEIEVTAVDLKVLPAVEEQAGFVPVELRLARSQCGPGDELPPPTIDPDDPDGPDLPRSVPAGDGGALVGAATGGQDMVPAAVALLALTTLATATGLTVQRRRVRAGD